MGDFRHPWFAIVPALTAFEHRDAVANVQMRGCSQPSIEIDSNVSLAEPAMVTRFLPALLAE